VFLRQWEKVQALLWENGVKVSSGFFTKICQYSGGVGINVRIRAIKAGNCSISSKGYRNGELSLTFQARALR